MYATIRVLSPALLLPGGGHAVSIPMAMLILFVSAKLMAEAAERLNQPGIVGEIIAGVLIGPSVLGLLSPSEFLSAMSDLGAMFLLFRVGLEVRSSELMRVGGTALLVATSGVIVPFIMGAGILHFWGAGANEAIFVGASLVATSVGITAQVLSAKGLLNEISSKVILAAAVIDDVLGLLVLAAVSSVTHGKLNILQLSATALLATAFTVIVAKWGTRAMGHIVPRIQESLRTAEARFVIALSLLFALAVLAISTGVAAIVGAFLAGLALAETAGPRERDLAQGVAEFLVPFFLAGIGLHVDLSAFAQPATAILAIVLLAAAVVSKFVGCGLGALGLGKAEALRIGVGMIPRGEVGMIVAQIGLGFGILTRASYGVVVFMSVATTIVAPPLIKLAYAEVLGSASIAASDEEILRLG
ncbi:MAG TPA: cation:proton antiporter [Bryobacteraceae bacterium]|jgi:Kef-type K+ transport system membrane component KefB|nr:cation:proton antiporter [Bryobacteraceae bacterium]